MRLLIVDDEFTARHILQSHLRDFDDVELHVAVSLKDARTLIEQHTFDIAFIDIRLGPGCVNEDGLTLVDELVPLGTQCVIVSGLAEFGMARAAMRAGAVDFLPKESLTAESLHKTIRRIEERNNQRREEKRLRAQLRSAPVPKIVGSSKVMQRLHGSIDNACFSDDPVLILGETGTGKDLVARSIHLLGPNPDAPFVPVNCAGITEALAESTFFGHVRGAFTGSTESRVGLFAEAKNGTLFLDELGELAPQTQAMLLRVLETRTFRAVGSTEDIHFTGRVVAATNADLQQRMLDRTFRSDLFHRMSATTIRVPSLSQHTEDIPELVEHFLRELGHPARFSSSAAREKLQFMQWSGNVRQLKNMAKRIAATGAYEISAALISSLIEQEPACARKDTDSAERAVGDAALALSATNIPKAVEHALYQRARELTDGSPEAVAAYLEESISIVKRRLSAMVRRKS